MRYEDMDAYRCMNWVMVHVYSAREDLQCLLTAR